MKFHVINNGDSSVGIQGFDCEVIIPNVVGADNSDWIDWCKGFLHEMYSSETTSQILTDEEYQVLVMSWDAEDLLAELEELE